MVRKAQEESSSSPSVNLSIQTLSERGNSGNLLKAVLSEGSSFFMARELLEKRDEWIVKGAGVDDSRLDRLRFLDNISRCRMKALDLLARRDHGTIELQKKLLKREFPVDAVSSTIQWLEGKGFLDDREFGRSWLRSRLRRGGDSPLSLEAALRKKGLSAFTVREILQEIPEDALKNSLGVAMDRLWRKPSMTREKCIQSLGRKGFPYTWIKEALEERND